MAKISRFNQASKQASISFIFAMIQISRNEQAMPWSHVVDSEGGSSFRLNFCNNSIPLPKDRTTEGRTDTPTWRVACTRPKSLTNTRFLIEVQQRQATTNHPANQQTNQAMPMTYVQSSLVNWIFRPMKCPSWNAFFVYNSINLETTVTEKIIILTCSFCVSDLLFKF